MWVLLGARSRVGNADLGEHVHRAGPRLLPRECGVDAQHFRDLVAHREDGIERRHRLLKDHGHVLTANVAQPLVIERQDVGAVEQNLASRLDAAWWWHQTQQRQRGERLAAAGFTHQADRLAAGDGERDPVYGTRHAVLRRKGDLQRVHIEQRTIGRGRRVACGRNRHGRTVREEGRAGDDVVPATRVGAAARLVARLRT